MGEMAGYAAAAREAAELGGEIVRRMSRGRRAARLKGATDLVTAADGASERAIRRFLARRFPKHAFLGEEGGRTGSGEWTWVVDPLDGTMNFAHGMPWVDVSVGLVRDGAAVAGAIRDPFFGHTYWAGMGLGAWRNGTRLRVSRRAPLRGCLLATGFASSLLDPGSAPRPEVDLQFRRFERLCLAARGVRRPGAAALDLAYVAAGIFDGFWESRLHAWDVAAGVVLVEEAGGRVTDFAGNRADLFGGEILATNGRIHRETLRALTPRRSPSARRRS
jgi:myo-inositol-1(or 4)-monophosphatase